MYVNIDRQVRHIVSIYIKNVKTKLPRPLTKSPKEKERNESSREATSNRAYKKQGKREEVQEEKTVKRKISMWLYSFSSANSVIKLNRKKDLSKIIFFCFTFFFFFQWSITRFVLKFISKFTVGSC